MWISRREYDMMEQQATYWREKYEEERARADQLTNNLLMTNGLPSVDVRKQRESDHPSAIDALKELTKMPELFGMDIEDKLEADTVDTLETTG